jgi:hypothetical protein
MDTSLVNTSEMFAGAVAACLAIYVAVKLEGLRRGPTPGRVGLVLYGVVWPGVATQPFARRSSRDPAALALAGQGMGVASIGVTAWIAVWHSAIGPTTRGWLGVAILLGTFHLGLSDVVTGGLRAAGFPVRRLFDAPLRSRSLREFWSRRWNVAFVQMNQIVVLPHARPWLGQRAWIAGFLASGLLHELAISVPVGTGFGGPMVYFTLQAVATGAEGRLRIARWHPSFARLWTWAWLLAPLPLLFHRAFRDAIVLPLVGGNR